jgi:hypothetical protein
MSMGPTRGASDASHVRCAGGFNGPGAWRCDAAGPASEFFTPPDVRS